MGWKGYRRKGTDSGKLSRLKDTVQMGYGNYVDFVRLWEVLGAAGCALLRYSMFVWIFEMFYVGITPISQVL